MEAEGIAGGDGDWSIYDEARWATDSHSDYPHQDSPAGSGSSAGCWEWVLRLWAVFWAAAELLDSVIKRSVLILAPVVYVFRNTSFARRARNTVICAFDRLNIALGIGGTDAMAVGSGALLIRSANQPQVGDPPRTPLAVQRALKESDFVKRGGSPPPQAVPDPGPDGPQSVRKW